MKSLAIIIPFFKIDFFEETLRSLKNQTVGNFSVYIGNDASNDDPEALIKKYNSKGNLFYKKFDKNLGGKGKLVQQWDRCIALSQDEEWLMILADDDYISNNFVEEFYKNLEEANRNNINLMRFKMRRVSSDNQFLVDLEQQRIHAAKNYVWEDETHQRFISISENVFSRKVYEDKGFRKYPLAWRVPMMMYLDFTSMGNVLGINEAFVAIRRSDQQLSWRKDVNEYKQIAMKMFYFDVLNEYSNHFNKNQNLKFLKVYTFYSKYDNKLRKNLSQLFLEYGGIKELIIYIIKRILKK